MIKIIKDRFPILKIRTAVVNGEVIVESVDLIYENVPVERCL